MRMFTILRSVCRPLLLLLIAGTAAFGYTNSPAVFSGGGGAAGSTGYAANGALGLPADAIASTSPGYVNYGGYWAAARATMPSLTAAPSSVSFPDTAAGTSSPARNVTLVNSGGSMLTVQTAVVSGASASLYSLTAGSVNPCAGPPFDLGAGQSCSLGVTFSPDSPGAKSAHLTISSNGSNGAALTVALAGNGVPGYTLSIAKAGTGAGTVSSVPAGISCGSDCTERYAQNEVVTLTATADPGSVFSGWAGPADCTDGQVTMTADLACTAVMTRVYTLTVSKSGLGAGSIASAPAGISCGGTCSAAYGSGSSVVLTATANPGSSFLSWTGCDSATGVSCTVTVGADRTVSARFLDDADGNLLSDAWEIASFGGTGAVPSADPDNDGLTTFAEAAAGTDPNVSNFILPDTDGDGLPDAYEIAHGLDPNNASDARGDADGDGYSNFQEYLFGLDPQVTDANRADTDGDGVIDLIEIAVGTDPARNDVTDDPDGDGMANLAELHAGTLPLLANGSMKDTDSDGIPDIAELAAGLDPAVSNATTDSDGDGIADVIEFANGTVGIPNASLLDTDGDGMPDIWEIAYGLNPAADDAAEDPDADGIPNIAEYQQGTNPRQANAGLGAASGDIDMDGDLDLADALKALRIAAGLDAATAGETARGDVAPLVIGTPAPDGKIDIGDVLVILRKIVGLW